MTTSKDNFKNWLSYWKNCLADADRKKIEVNSDPIFVDEYFIEHVPKKQRNFYGISQTLLTKQLISMWTLHRVHTNMDMNTARLNTGKKKQSIRSGYLPECQKRVSWNQQVILFLFVISRLPEMKTALILDTRPRFVSPGRKQETSLSGQKKI